MSENKSQMHNIRFTPAELATLQRIADERSCSVGAAVRAAVKAQYIEPPGAKKNEGYANVSEAAGVPFHVQS